MNIYTKIEEWEEKISVFSKETGKYLYDRKSGNILASISIYFLK